MVQPPTGIGDPLALVTPVDVTVTLAHVPVLLPDSMVTPTGIVSTNGAVRFCIAPVAFDRKMLSDDAPPRSTTWGAKDLDEVGSGATVNVPEIGVALLPPLVVTSAPAGIVFVNAPAVVPVTVTVTAHDPLAGIDPPERLNVLPFAAATTAPPVHVVEAAGAVALRIPAG
jgi:hypothetical protein